MKKLSIRLRITILTAIILVVSSVALTVASMYTVKYLFRTADLEEIGESQIIRERQFNYIGVASMVIVIIAGTVAAYIIAGKALKPATNLCKQIEDRNESDLFAPVTYKQTNDEISHIAESFNIMLTKLEASYNTQRRFSANAAHELRTPLSSIIAAIEVLKIDDSDDIEEYREVTADVLDNALRLKLLVDNLLKLSMELNVGNFQEFNTREIFDDIIFELSAEAKKKKIVVKNLIEEFKIIGDKELLKRAFFNVVQNAIKYNKLSGVVEITAENFCENSLSYIKIIIYDGGIGMKEEEYEKIFEPFYCCDKSRSRENGGIGLGLSLVKTIIEKHKGKITVESTYGEYTRIKILLPTS